MAGDGDGGDWDGDGGGADMVGAGGMFFYADADGAAEPSSLPQPTSAPSPSPATPAPPTSSPTPISILLDDLLLECLAGVPYASLPQLPTTSPRLSPPSRARRAPLLSPRPLRHAHGEPMDVGVVVVTRTRSRRPPTRSYAPSPPLRSTAGDWMGIDPLSSFPCKVNKMTRGKYARE
jgi:hypothetical protein